MKQIALFGSSVASKSLTVSDQRRVNLYYEVRQDGDKAKFAIYGTPGQILFASLPSSVRGWWVFGGKFVVAAGGLCYTITSGAVITQIGTLQTAAGFVSMSDNGKGVLIVDGLKGYFWDGTTFTSPIVDANFPNGATTVTFNDTYFIADNPSGVAPGQYNVSPGYYLPGTAWGALAFQNASSNPDALNAIDSDHGFVIAWGASSIEFHQDTGIGLNPQPYFPIPLATQQVGLTAKWSRAKFNNTMAFLGTNLQGLSSVYMLEGFQPKVISTPDIDAFFDDFPLLTDAVAQSYVWDGHPFYVLTFPSANRTFSYDGSTGIWQEQQSGVGLINRYNANLAIVFNNLPYVSDSTNGNIYQLSDDVYTDNGNPIMRLLQTRHIHDDGNMLRLDEMYLDLETGVGLQSGQGSSPQIMVSVSKDGGRTFGNERLMSIGAVGQYIGPRATLRRFGASRDFIFRFRMTDPVKFACTYGAVVSGGLGK